MINASMKERGMRWEPTNTTAVVTLGVQLINADWEAAFSTNFWGKPFVNQVMGFHSLTKS
jgi:hypothetical protein